jgi:Aerotolerance regulator N-terminal
LSSSIFLVSPLWLLGLIPWTALTIYLLIARPRQVPVPFLRLWQDLIPAHQARRARRLPPLPVLSVLAAILLAILAAAGPAAGPGSGTDRPVIIIADRGITMSARQGAQRRFGALAIQCGPDIRQMLGSGPADLIVIPGGEPEPVGRDSFANRIAVLNPTAIDTRETLTFAARRALLDPQAIVLLLSDQKIGLTDERLIQIVPAQKVSNIGIASFAVRAAPAPQAMVRLVNDSMDRQSTLRVSGMARPISVVLPPPGQSRNYFVDLTGIPATVQASVEPGGDIDADDQAWAVRNISWPKVIPTLRVDPELQRMFQVYAAHRPAGPESRTITVAPLGDPQAGVQIMTDSAQTTPLSVGHVNSEPSDITSGIDWSAAIANAHVALAQPDASWHRLVWTDDRTLIAARTEPMRQVWVGFGSSAWAATPDFVMFWTKVLDWAGQGADRYVTQTAGDLQGDSHLWPGLYRQGAQTLAINAPEVHLDPANPTDWQTSLASLTRRQPANHSDLSPPILAAAIACLLISVTLPRRS